MRAPAPKPLTGCPFHPECGCAPSCEVSPAVALPRVTLAGRILLGSILAAAICGVFLAFN